MKKLFLFLGIISAFFVLLISCEKESDLFEFTYQLKNKLEEIEIIEYYPEYFFDTLAPVKIRFSDNYRSGAKILIEGNTYDVKPTFSYIDLKRTDFQYAENLSENKDILTLDFFKCTDVFEARLYFKWERKDGDMWKPIENAETYKTITIKNYPYEVIHNFVESFSIADSAEVSIYCTPKINFKYIIGETIDISNLNYYVIPEVKKAGIIDKDGNEVSSELMWNESLTSLTIKPKEILNENSEYRLYVENAINIQYRPLEKKSSSNKSKFQSSAYNEKVFLTQSSNSTNLIDHENIEYSYPIVNQYNFLPSEHDQGYLKIKYGQKEITGDPNNPNIDYYIRFIDIANHDTLEYNVNFNDNYFSYHILDKLKNTTIYKVELFKDEETTKTIIFQYHFRTSSYNTFNEKITDLFISSGYRISRDFMYEVGNTIFGDELFDKFDLKELMKFEINIEGYDWYNEYNLSLFYSGMLETTLRLTNRKASIYGVPPRNAMYVRQIGMNIELTDSDIQNQTASWDGYATEGGFVCKVQNVIYNDVVDIRSQIYDNDLNTNWADFVKDIAMLADSHGALQYKIKYILPGGILSSVKDLSISW